MNYGDGDAAGGNFFEFTGALDVIAHEIDHGFTQFHSNLTYSAQSGGMNESFSDIAGTTAKFYYDAKTADFNLGGDIFQKANTYIRYMCKPSMDGMSIDTATAYKSGLDVHYSSGVMNRAFCRSAKRLSGADPDTGTATVDGVKKASQAFYEANASHWTSSATWVPGCQGVVDAATALKFSPGDISGLGDSWKDVGVDLHVHARQRLRPDARAGDGDGDGGHDGDLHGDDGDPGRQHGAVGGADDHRAADGRDRHLRAGDGDERRDEHADDPDGLRHADG